VLFEWDFSLLIFCPLFARHFLGYGLRKMHSLRVWFCVRIGSHQLHVDPRKGLSTRPVLIDRYVQPSVRAVFSRILCPVVCIDELHEVPGWNFLRRRRRDRVALVQQLLSWLLRCGFGCPILHAVRAWHDIGLGRHELRYSRSPKLLARHLLRNGEVRSQLHGVRRWILCVVLGLVGLHALPCGQVFYSWRNLLCYLPSKHYF